MDQLNIKKAKADEFEQVVRFYHSVIDALQDAEYNLGWIKDVYPSRDLLKSTVEKGELYLGEIDGETVSAMIVNGEFNDGYKDVKWGTELDSSELLVIHALTSHPDHSGKGIATKMVQKAIELGKSTNAKAIRLDVLSGNYPAERLYRKLGFKYVDTVPMFYENTGLTDFLLFEYTL